MRGPKVTLSSTSSHGNSMASWNTTQRSGPGPSTGLPWTSTSPSVHFSKPAAMLRMVDLPHPLEPSTQISSPWRTSRVKSSITAMRCRERAFSKYLATWRNSIRPAISVPTHPWHQHALEAHDRDVQKITGHAEQKDADHHDIGAQEGAGVDDHPSEAGFGGDHLGRDQRGPADSECKPHGDQQLWQRVRQDDVAKQLKARDSE